MFRKHLRLILKSGYITAIMYFCNIMILNCIKGELKVLPFDSSFPLGLMTCFISPAPS